MKDKWRYIYFPEWALDEMIPKLNEEEIIISRLDGEEEDEMEMDAYALLSTLSKKEADVVEKILFDGKTFHATGIEMGLSKQRIHQIYKSALIKLKGVIDGTP